MEITSNTTEDTGYITLIGQLWQKEDLCAIDEAVENLIQNNITKIVLDLDRLGFINSSGLGLLARTHSRITELGHKFILLNPHSSVLEVIEVSGFDLFMTIAKSADELKIILAKK